MGRHNCNGLVRCARSIPASTVACERGIYQVDLGVAEALAPKSVVPRSPDARQFCSSVGRALHVRKLNYHHGFSRTFPRSRSKGVRAAGWSRCRSYEFESAVIRAASGGV